jgi:hypothetical protein
MRDRRGRVRRKRFVSNAIPDRIRAPDDLPCLRLCSAINLAPRLRSFLFRATNGVQPTDNGFLRALRGIREAMPISAGPEPRPVFFWKTRARVDLLAIVVTNEFLEDPLQVSFVNWDQIVLAFAADRSHEPFAESVRLRNSGGRFQHAHPQS